MSFTIETRSKKRSSPTDHSVPVVQEAKKSKNVSKTSPSWSLTSNKVKKLWNAGEEPNLFSDLWKASDLETKRVFVTLLDSDTSALAKRMKSIYANVIYRGTEAITLWPEQNQPTFYHATSLENAEGILKSGSIHVKRNSGFKGAFVATRPEPMFGKIIFVFNRSIERLTPLLDVGSRFIGSSSYWAGFASPIPVTDQTLVKILILVSKEKYNLVAVQIRKFGWVGLVIEPYKEMVCYPVVPHEWPSIIVN